MNKVYLIGNLTRDPELTETASGVPVCHFSIAVNRNYSSQDGERQTDFFNCTAWRAMAETIARYTKKGKKIAVVGSIQLRNYEDNQGVKFLSPREAGDAFDEIDDAPRASAQKRKPVLQAMDDDSDIPF